MRVQLILLLLLLSGSTIGQTLTGAEKKLFKSIDSISLTEKLYREIADLESRLEYSESRINNLAMENYQERSFSQWHQRYREILDELELGIFNYDEYNYGFSRTEGKGQDSVSVPVLTLTIDTTHPASSVAIRLFKRDSLLQKIYPAVFRMIKSGAIKFEMGIISFLLAANQVPRLQFPSLSLRSDSYQEKKKLADLYYTFISVTAMKEIEGDLIPVYLKLEKKLVPNNNLDKLIDLRKKFVLHLKEIYATQ